MNALSDLNPVSRWLDVSGCTGQNINSLPMNMVFSDISCDTDYKLLIGDMGSTITKPKLKVFKGTNVTNEIILPDIPTAVASYFTNENVPRNSPVIVVSMCSSVYIYKNMKLFYKFFLPPLEVQSLEVDVWRQLIDGYLDESQMNAVVEKLNTLSYTSLTSQSQHLLSLRNDQYSAFIKKHPDHPTQKHSVITCMTTLNMNSKETDAVACLVLGTENGDIFILDPQTFSIISQARVSSVKSTPTLIESSGLFDVEYRIVIATREGGICILRRQWLEGKCLIQPGSLAVGLIITPGDNSIVLACQNKTLQCFTKKGKKSWTVSLEYQISCTALVQLAHLGANLIAVALQGGSIHFYNGKNLVDSIHMQETVSMMKFGQIGQEEHVLALVTIDGDLILKILKRTADFNLTSMGLTQKSHPSLLSAQHGRPLLVPKKSKLFLEQAAREREQAIEMHETFQRELCFLRLHVARETVEAMKNSSCSLSAGTSETIKLSAQVEGLGPVFKVHLVLENLTLETAVTNLTLLLTADLRSYNISTPYISVPMLVGGHPYTYLTRVAEHFLPDEGLESLDREINEETNVDEKSNLQVVLVKDGKTQPLLAASIYIPPTDPLMMPF